LNFLKRAQQYLIHKKGQSFLLFLIMTAILIFILLGIIIQSAAVSATESATKSAGTTITVSANRNKMFKNMKPGSSSSTKITTPTVSNAKAKKAGQLSTVASYNIQTTALVTANSFDPIETTTGSSGAMKGGPGGTSSTSSGDTTLSGVTSTKLASDFTSKTSKLVSGRNITASDAGTKNVVIEKQLAKQDALKVGSTIKIKTTSKKYVTMKVVGIYKTSSSSSMPGSDPSNTIYTSYTLPASINGKENKASTVTYTLSNSKKSKATIKQIKSIISDSDFSVTSDDSTYQSLLQPMKNVKAFASKIVWLVAAAGTIILALIIILSVRSRRREIGILVSLGESKSKIVAQLFSELFIIMIASLVVASLFGNIVGNKVGNQLLAQQNSSLTTSTSTGTSTGGPGGGGQGQAPGGTGGGAKMGRPGMSQGTTSTSKASQLKSLKTTITPSSIMKLGGLGFVIIALAVCVASIGILRLKPKKILTSE